MWHIYNDFRPSIVTSMAIESNLELIMNDEYEVLAFRYDHPHDMTHMVVDDGKWHFTTEGRSLSDKEFQRLELLCRKYSIN